MILPVLLLCIYNQLDITGYAETRPYVLWGDSTRVTGFTRGWLEGKTGTRMYGAQMSVELIVPYDTNFSGTLSKEVFSISRCAVWIGPEHTRVIVGRQRINWGVGRVFRPLDVFNPINYFEPGYERPGSNAILGYLAFDEVTSLRGIYTPRYDPAGSLYGTSIRTTVLHNDLGITAVHRPEEYFTLVGTEIAGELLIGYWGEGALVQKDTFDYSTFTLGFDFSFPLRIYAMIEYFFDGSGVDDPAQYDFSLISTGERMTLAQQYLYGTISTIPLPFDILRPSLSALVNLNDQGVAIIPQVSIAPFENADIAVGSNFFVAGDECEFRNITPFKGAAYVWIKVYF